MNFAMLIQQPNNQVMENLMNCPRCDSHNILQRKVKTKNGLTQYQCRPCHQYFNERTGADYNFTHYPNDIIYIVVFFYYRYKLSLVDVTEIMALRGIYISHETVRQWAQRFGTDIGVKFRARRWGQPGLKWHMDITYLKVKGYDMYLYRAIDKAGNLIDVYLSDTRNKKALGHAVKHRDNKYMNNRVEQHHRGIKSRYRPMKGFKDSWAAMISCYVFEEIQQFFRNKKPLSQHRRLIASRFQKMMVIANHHA